MQEFSSKGCRKKISKEQLGTPEEREVVIWYELDALLFCDKTLSAFKLKKMGS